MRRAADACRKASQHLAAARDAEVFGQQHVTDERGAQQARDLVLLALSEHQAVDVVVITSATFAAPSTSTAPAQGAKETST